MLQSMNRILCILDYEPIEIRENLTYVELPIRILDQRASAQNEHNPFS